MRTKTFMQTFIAAGLLLGCGILVSCNFSVNGIVTADTTNEDTVSIQITSTPSTTPIMEEDSVVEAEESVEEVQSYSRKDIVGIYDTEDYDRFCFDADGTGSAGILGSLNFTSFDYFIEGDEIVVVWGDGSQMRLKIKDGGKAVYSEDDDLMFYKEE